jgi:hypothetical protein
MNDEQKQQSAAGTYLDALDKSKGSNRDTEGLGVMSNGLFAIGAVDEINGSMGEEVELPVTRYEVEQHPPSGGPSGSPMIGTFS